MKRVEDFGVTFKNGFAEGWAFGVSEAFRDQLDILYLQYVDRDRSRELREQRPRTEDGNLPTVFRMAWNRGVPPMLSFDAGHIFYDPPTAHGMVWRDALKVLRRSVQVTAARTDELPGSGWVKIEVRHFEHGRAVLTQDHNLSQAEFETLLRTGQWPVGHEAEAKEMVQADGQRLIRSDLSLAGS